MTDQTRAVRGVRRPRLRRAGAITLELIIMLPVWLIMLGAIVQFGLLIGNRQQVALASRVGAEEASRTSLPSGGGVPLNVVHVVEQQLQGSGIDQCKITLEHNVVPPTPPAPAAPVVLSSGDCGCPTTPPATPLPPQGEYVRVTVYVPATQLAPNVLKIFGLDLSEWLVPNSTTFRHELTPGVL